MGLFKAAAIFSDHMVLQQGKRVPVWGTGGKNGAAVSASCLGATAETIVADGRWRLELPPMDAGGPYELELRSGEEAVVFADVWIGEVWLAGGQSNMEWSLEASAEGAEELPQANVQQFRYYNVPRVEWEEGEPPHSAWQLCEPDAAKGFSAVAYHFARRVHRELNVPIGIIGCNWGGTSASCWMSEQALAEREEFHVYAQEFANQLEGFTWEKYAEQRAEYEAAIARVNELTAQGAPQEEIGNYPWPPPISPHSFFRPSGLHNTMLTKAAPYALQGFLYYQGESDAGKPVLYADTLAGLVGDWRRLWQAEELPFLLVQLPGYGCDGNPDGEDWALLRESQQLVSETVPHTGLAVIIECGEEHDIHPGRKRPVGDRLARVALHNVYGKDVAASGPKAVGIEADGDTLVVAFDQLRGDGCIDLPGFEIAGEDAVFAKAEARRDGSKVILRSEAVAAPKHVRYAWANWPAVSLFNEEGLPAAPFRTDSRNARAQ